MIGVQKSFGEIDKVRTCEPATGFEQPCSLQMRGGDASLNTESLEDGTIFIYSKILSLLLNVQNYSYSAENL